MPADSDRIRSLREVLNHERTLALARVREYRVAQEQEDLSPPGDELDVARALAEVETHASLVERAEDRLRAVDSAFHLLERGRYGICAECGEQIPLERLKAMPFASLCVECQHKRNQARRSGGGTLDEPFAHVWNVPEEMTESTETSRDEFVPFAGESALEELPTLTPRPRVRRLSRPRSRPVTRKRSRK